jgi:hypothetical protein
MSGSVQANTFSVGRDVSVIVISALGVRLDLTGQIEFTRRPIWHRVRHEPLNQPPQERQLPGGHEFSISLERKGPENEQLFSLIEQGYWAGGYPNGTQAGGTVFVYEYEPDGSVSAWMGSNVSLGLNEAMRAEQKSAIRQTIEGFASTWAAI